MQAEPKLISNPSGPPVLSVEDAGWSYVSFRVDRLRADERQTRDSGPEEVALVPLSGRIEVRSEGERWQLGGRESVFAGLPEALYLPRGLTYEVSAMGDGVELATCGARAERDFPPRLVGPDDYEAETRGAGNATRQVATLVPPDFPAHRLLVVEVWTPAGNWSSYPPHKHEQRRPPEEVPLEETYYYRLDKPDGFAVQRLYSPQRQVDRSWILRDGDLLTVPWGYHTTAAVPGYDLYYLNVLAGEERALAAAEDPSHAWVRSGWDDEGVDERVPLVPS